MLITDMTVYPEHAKIIEACLCVESCINKDKILDFEQFWYDVAKNETVPDYDGNEVHGREDVKLYYMPVFDLNGNVPFEIEQKFQALQKVLINMIGVTRANIVFIGPNSIVPRHIDDEKIPAYTNSVCFNVYTGVYVPNNTTINIDGEAVSHARHKAVIFDAQQPHYAKNDSSEWWVSLLIYINKDTFNL